jgi:PadR family transcriptional regulator, regulatory protein PadR
MTNPLDLMQGTLDVLILKALSWEPMHGYAITTFLRTRTDGTFDVEEGALYHALHRLDRRGLVKSEWGLSENNRKAKYYDLTAAGRNALKKETQRFERYARAVFTVLEIV